MEFGIIFILTISIFATMVNGIFVVICVLLLRANQKR